MSKRAFLACSALLIVLIGVLRFSLLGKGALSSWDEVRYLILARSLGLLDPNAAHTSFLKIIEGITGGTLGRPGILVFWTPAILLQRTVGLQKFGMLSPESLYVPQLFSWFYSVLSLVLFACLSGTLCNGKYWWALLGILLYGLLSNSTFYVRAVNPYDPSLCCFMGVILLLLRSSLGVGTVFCAGLLGGLGFLTYPGYYWCFVPACFSLLQRLSGTERQRKLGIFACGALALPSIVEVLSSAAGHSYSSVLRFLASTVSSGDSGENLVFPLKYLINVEGIAGITLTAMMLYVGASALTHRRLRALPPAYLFFATLFCMLLHGVVGVIFGAPVFYGRLLHAYLPFYCLTVILLGELVQTSFARTTVSLLIVVAAGMHGYKAFSQLWTIEYPRDRFFELLERNPEWEFARRVNESDQCSPITERPSFAALTFPSVEERTKSLTLVNFCDFYDITEAYRPLTVSNSPSVETKDLGPHFINFLAYIYEGYDPKERRLAQEREYHLYAVTTR